MGPPARAHLGICEALALLLAAEARQWTWPHEGGSSFFVLLMLRETLESLACDFARNEEGLQSVVEHGLRDLKGLLPVCGTSEFGMSTQ
jgi:hypothetical protein